MINLEKVKGFCREDISKIQNYEEAVKDEIHVWDCHHRLGKVISKEMLKKIGWYYDRPAAELIFLTKSQHMRLHMLGNTRGFKKGQISCMKGKKHTEEAKRKNSEAHKGNSNRSKRINQIDLNTGEIIKTWLSAAEVERQLGISHGNISSCCCGRKGYKSAGGFGWRYAD